MGPWDALAFVGLIVFLVALEVLQNRHTERSAQRRIDAALNELGVPHEGTPAPVANAVAILRGEKTMDRHEALEQAIRSSLPDATTEEIVKRAEAFLSFAADDAPKADDRG